jgi:hypothetical protein
VTRLILVAVLLFAVASPARSARVWLVVAGSDASAEAIARKAKELASVARDGLVVQTKDCGDRKSMFAWVAAITADAELAKPVLARVRDVVKDAYLRPCDVREHSLLALRVTAVDPSIADVPATAVNWEERDRVSELRPLANGSAVLVVRYFARAINDPLEGRRERVALVAGGKQTVLDEDCPSVRAAGSESGLLALECAREQAGDHLLHTVRVFDRSGRKLHEIQRCRTPSWVGAATLACDAEAVGADGKLALRRQRTDIAVKPGTK